MIHDELALDGSMHNMELFKGAGKRKKNNKK